MSAMIHRLGGIYKLITSAVLGPKKKERGERVMTRSIQHVSSLCVCVYKVYIYIYICVCVCVYV